MVLLGWDILRPHNSLAAIRYPSLVRVSSIRVFPTGAQPFSQSPETVAVTEPSSFFVDVLFNASILPSSSQDSQEKRVVKNALASTQIAYAGDATEFTVDMGVEYATRLIIFHGDFEVISVAIYGEVVAEPSEVLNYEPSHLPALTSTPLSTSVDVANATNPTQLAEQLLSLLPVPPPLPLVSRLIFSLKPEDEDWDHPDFPYLYSDMDDVEELDLASLVQSVTRPIRDDISPDILSRFATRVHDSLGSNPSDDAYYAAKLLVKASSQQTRICLTILQHLDLPKVFNEHTADDPTLYFLLDAAANIEIARYFSEDEEFFSGLQEMQQSPKTDKSNAKILKKLISRIRGWQSFEHALSNVTGDFEAGVAFLKEISSGEHSLGCWLECMLIHDNLISKLEGTQISSPAQPPPRLFQEKHASVSHGQFVTFVRALLGVAAVLAALSWSDSIGNGQCRERALALLVLWQGVEGYREIVNHCLLLRQLTKRLGWNKTDELPTKSGNFAERLLVGLAKDPQSFLQNHMCETVLSLEPPFSFIGSEELLEIVKLARVGQDGLLSAIDELSYSSVRPFSLRRLRVLRVSITIVEEELTYDDGEAHVAENFWQEKHQGVVPTLTSILADIADDVSHHFILQPIPPMNQGLSELLFRTADDLLRVLGQFIHVYKPPSRDLGQLTTSIADLYVCSRVACERFTPSSAAYLAALNIRPACTQIIHTLLNDAIPTDLDVQTAQVVLRTLFNHASRPSGRDPVIHVAQLYDLIYAILPQPPASTANGVDHDEPSFWPSMVFPKILSDLRTFWDLLEVDIRAHFIERIEALDHGEMGIGEWLLTEEMKALSEKLVEITGLEQFKAGSDRTIILYGISASLSFFEHLISTPDTAPWTLSSLSTNTDLAQLLDNCLTLILDVNVYSTPLTQIMRQLGKHANDFSPDIRFHILLLILRNAQLDPSVTDALDFVPGILKGLPSASISIKLLRSEMGRTISAYAEHTPSLKADNSEMLFAILEWLAEQTDAKLTTLSGLTLESFRHLCSMLLASLPPERQEALTAVEAKLGIDEDQDFAYLPTELPEKLIMPLETIEHMLSPKPLEPSTPKRGTKTPDILGVVISPPTALLRSPAATGLTKTYTNNDFRQLRQVSSTRLNTSRLPSTHGELSLTLLCPVYHWSMYLTAVAVRFVTVDDFEHATASPTGLLAAAQIDPQVGMMINQGIFPVTGL